MIRCYKIGDKVQYDAPNSTSAQHVNFVGIITEYGTPCMTCADGTHSYYVETQYGPRIVCETVLRRIVELPKPKDVCGCYGSLMQDGSCRNCGHPKTAHI